MKNDEHIGLQALQQWFAHKQWQAFPFQQTTWQAFLSGKSGLLNAPTGSGKTYALWLPCLAEYMAANPHDYSQPKTNGLRVLWITPLRALAKDIQRAMQEATDQLGVAWRVALRTGDITAAEKQKIKKNLPECLITTPESLHIMLAQKHYDKLFGQLDAFIVDEWHELLGSKRGVQVELALSRLRALQPSLKVWGISATIGNLAEAAQVLLPTLAEPLIIRAKVRKKLEVVSLLPDIVEKFPWAGHLGLNMIPKILPIIAQSKTTLLFTNTRAQTEIWYQKLLDAAPELAGAIAMHHGSLDAEIRKWVEEALHKGILKLVVCTSSLDLGVDFRPVETVIQVGSPKGVARFLQRAGRSGHQPDALSRIYFLPTHSLELVEASALRTAAEQVTHYDEVSYIERRFPLTKSLDVLVQYLVTLAVSDGFEAQQTYKEVTNTFAYKDLSPTEWDWVLQFITSGGESLNAYQEFCKVEMVNTRYQVTNRRVAMRHRMSIGTIVSEPMVKVKYKTGGYIGMVEEWFVSRLKQGDVFFFAGRNLELLRFREMTATVKNSNKKSNQIPRYLGGRLSLTSELSDLIRLKLEDHTHTTDVEIRTIRPLLALQETWSAIPRQHELLIEKLHTREGFHLFFYPFQGRVVHEVMAALVAYRISQMLPVTFSLAMNDYGFELLANQEVPLEHALEMDLFAHEALLPDLEQSMNNAEMAKRRFRDIASIAGLIFQGFPGKNTSNKHLQASSQLLFQVFSDYDPDNLLVKQAYDEVLNQQLDFQRIATALQDMRNQKVVIKTLQHPSPFAFPIMVDRLRNQISSESIEDRATRMQMELEQYIEANS